MYVCICRAVTEQQVKSAIDSGARTVEAVTRACCAGDDCGACRGLIEEMIECAADAAPRVGGASPAVEHRLPVVRERAA